MDASASVVGETSRNPASRTRAPSSPCHRPDRGRAARLAQARLARRHAGGIRGRGGADGDQRDQLGGDRPASGALRRPGRPGPQAVRAGDLPAPGGERPHRRGGHPEQQGRRQHAAPAAGRDRRPPATRRAVRGGRARADRDPDRRARGGPGLGRRAGQQHHRAPAGHPGRGQRPVGRRGGGDDHPGPAGDLHDRDQVRRQHRHPARGALLPAVRHRGHRRRGRHADLAGREPLRAVATGRPSRSGRSASR